MLAGRVLTALASLAMLVIVVVGVLPNPGTADRGARRVNCGTMFVPSEHGGDDGCEHEILGRFMYTFVLWLAALVLGAIGLVLLYRDVRYA